MVEHQAHRILNDNEHVVGIWSGASEWGAREWFPRLRKAGMRRFAWVDSPTRFSQISTDTTLSMMQCETQGVMVFSDVKEAIFWLHESDEREEHLSDWVEKSKRLGVPQEVIAGMVGNNWHAHRFVAVRICCACSAYPYQLFGPGEHRLDSRDRPGISGYGSLNRDPAESSAINRPLQGSDIDFLHLQHGRHRLSRAFGVGIIH